jgi:hypothetical protein
MPLSIIDPSVGGDNGSWGTKLNTALDAIVVFVNSLETSIAATLAKAGGTMTGLLNLKTTTTAHVHQAGTSGTQTLDLLAAQSFDATVAGATVFAFSNAPVSANALSGLVLRLVNGGAASVTWPASVKWASGTAPALTAVGTDVLVFLSDDNGTTWRGSLAVKDAR